MGFDRAWSARAPGARASVREAAPPSTVRVPPGARRWIEASGRRGLVAIRAAIGAVFVACGAIGLLKLAPVDLAAMQHGAVAFGGAALVAGALLPLLKGTEVLIEVMLDRVSVQRASRPSKH